MTPSHLFRLVGPAPVDVLTPTGAITVQPRGVIDLSDWPDLAAGLDGNPNWANAHDATQAEDKP